MTAIDSHIAAWATSPVETGRARRRAPRTSAAPGRRRPVRPCTRRTGRCPRSGARTGPARRGRHRLTSSPAASGRDPPPLILPLRRRRAQPAPQQRAGVRGSACPPSHGDVQLTGALVVAPGLEAALLDRPGHRSVARRVREAAAVDLVNAAGGCDKDDLRPEAAARVIVGRNLVASGALQSKEGIAAERCAGHTAGANGQRLAGAQCNRPEEVASSTESLWRSWPSCCSKYSSVRATVASAASAALALVAPVISRAAVLRRQARWK